MPITDLQLITVTGTYLKLDGSPASGSVVFTASTVIVNTAADEIVYPYPFTATLDGTGSFSIVLPATNDPDLTPVGWTYRVKENITGSTVSREFDIEVPFNAAGATIDMADVAPAEVPAAFEVYALAKHTHSAPANVSPITGMLHAKGFGAVGDAKQVRDAVTTNGSKVVTSALAPFDGAVPGMVVSAYKLGSPAIYVGTIEGVDSDSQIRLAGNANLTTTGVWLTWGTDNLAALQAWADAIPATGGRFFLDSGWYAISAPLVIQDKTAFTMMGTNNGLRAGQFMPTSSVAPRFGSSLVAIGGHDAIHIISTAATQVTRPSGIVFNDFGIMSAGPILGHGIKVTATGSGGATDNLTLRSMTIVSFLYGFWGQHMDVTNIVDSWISENGYNIHSEDSIYTRVQNSVVADSGGGNGVEFIRDFGSRVVDPIGSHCQKLVYAEDSTNIRVTGGTINESYNTSVHFKGVRGGEIDTHFIRCFRDAVLLEDTSDVVVGGTFLGTGYSDLAATADLLFDHVRVTGASARNRISPKLARASQARAPVGAFRTRYGVRIDSAACYDNDISGADLFGAGGLGAISDLGTRTTQTVPNKMGGAVNDEFARTNAASLGSADTGQAWTAHSATWGTDGASAYTASGSSGSNIATVDLGSPDAVVTTVVATSSIYDGGLVLRFVDANNHFAQAAGVVYQIQGGGASQVASFTAPVPGDKQQCVMSGSLFEFYVNGVLVATWTSTFNQSATRHGLRTYIAEDTRFASFNAVVAA